MSSDEGTKSNKLKNLRDLFIKVNLGTASQNIRQITAEYSPEKEETNSPFITPEWIISEGTTLPQSLKLETDEKGAEKEIPPRKEKIKTESLLEKEERKKLIDTNLYLAKSNEDLQIQLRSARQKIEELQEEHTSILEKTIEDNSCKLQILIDKIANLEQTIQKLQITLQPRPISENEWEEKISQFIDE